MSDFARQLENEKKLRDVSELPTGVIVEGSRVNVIIPECCREGWATCPHVAKKIKPAKRNIGL